MSTTLYAGTSGYSFKEWKGPFYPEDLKSDAMLQWYAGRLPAVEINSTFYRRPRPNVLEAWTAQVGPDFKFALKAPQRITHMRRLQAAEEEVAYLLDTVQVLGPHLGVLLFQLPPNMKLDVERLAAFLELFPRRAPVAWEFRHASWSNEAVLALLAQRNLAWCVSDIEEEPVQVLPGTADWGYLRLRRQDYTDADLSEWGRKIQATGWERAYVFFKHEDAGIGPRLATRFLELNR